ncbi:MAG: sugar phosphate isomerase/epimerase [Cyclobacteriaceae bacterium]|nr:sugar phosphate isomerase/epimerase [Cyclobacteriaceae bacterium]
MHNFLLIFLLLIGVVTKAQHARYPQIGIVQNLERDSLLATAGFDCLVESVASMISPKNVSAEQFEQNLNRLKNLRLPVYAFNIFMPGELKLVGPAMDEAAILGYAEIVFQRCQQAGVHMIIWGSGGARRIPDGFTKKKATTQFISLARKVSSLAKKYNITLALENLNRTETNFINTLQEAHDVVKKVNHPNFRLCADIYHMLMENEPPARIESSKKYLVHVDIAEKNGRTPPGVDGEDFKPYLKALKKINYTGKIILECRWENLSTQAAPAFLYLEQQLKAVYGN